MIDIDNLTNAQLDRLNDRLAARASQRSAELAAAERERLEPRPLRPQIGDGGISFGNERSRANWDRECLAALEKQTVRFAVAPMTSVLTRDQKRLVASQEVRPAEHLDARLGDTLVQMARLVASGHVLEKAGAA